MLKNRDTENWLVEFPFHIMDDKNLIAKSEAQLHEPYFSFPILTAYCNLSF